MKNLKLCKHNIPMFQTCDECNRQMVKDPIKITKEQELEVNIALIFLEFHTEYIMLQKKKQKIRVYLYAKKVMKLFEEYDIQKKSNK